MSERNRMLWQDNRGRWRFVVGMAGFNDDYVVVQDNGNTVTRSREEGLEAVYPSKAEAQAALDAYAVRHHWRQKSLEDWNNGTGH